MGGEVLKNILSVHYLLLPGSYLFDRFVPLTKLVLVTLPCLPCCAAPASGGDDVTIWGAEGGGDAAAECQH